MGLNLGVDGFAVGSVYVVNGKHYVVVSVKKGKTRVNRWMEREQANLIKDAPKKADRSAKTLGVKGGLARAESLSPEKRSEIAKKAANARWARSSGKPSSVDPLPDADNTGPASSNT